MIGVFAYYVSPLNNLVVNNEIIFLGVICHGSLLLLPEIVSIVTILLMFLVKNVRRSFVLSPVLQKGRKEKSLLN